MNRRLIALAALLAAGAAAVPASAEVNARQLNQERHIDAGERSGSLTRSEVRRLRDEQREISRMERRYRADGRYTQREKDSIHAMQERAGRRIERMKHDH